MNLARPGDVAWLDEFLLDTLVRLSCRPLRVRPQVLSNSERD